MDERLEKALDFSNYMVTLNNQKTLLKEQYYQDLIHYYNGGQFNIDQQLISFCSSLLALHQTDCVLVDENNIPIQIEDLEKFLQDILNQYSQASNSFLLEYEKLKKNRSTKGLVDL